MRQYLFTTLFMFLTAAIIAAPHPTDKYIYHTVEKGETLYSISHQYGLKPQDLAQYNDALGDKLTIHIGQKLRIPSADAATDAAAPAPEPVAKPTPSAKVHVVEKGETVFSISKMYGVSKADLMAWNKIKDNSISVGQKLKIKDETPVQGVAGNEKPFNAFVTSYSDKANATAEPTITKADMAKAMKKDGYTWTMPTEASKNPKTNVSTASGDITASTSAGGLSESKTIKSWKEESTTDIREYYKGKANVYDPSAEYESLYYQNIYSGMTKKTETGVVKFALDNNTSNTAYYNKAPIGTILKLTNTDNGKSTYAIVIGKIPPAEEKSYLMKLSGKVARTLSSKDYSSVEVVCYTEN